MNTYTVGHVARMSGTTVRTLHHYDDIGLLSPAQRSDGGYRLYDDSDIDRLREILAFRELGLGLDEVAEAIESSHGLISTLRNARQRLAKRIDHLSVIADSLDTAIHAHEKGTTMSAEEKLSVFGDFDPTEYEAEAREHWGGTDAYAESAKRTAAYTHKDWERIAAEGDAIYRRAGALAAEGAAIDGASARSLVDEHRAHIDRAFYECTPEIHAGLGTMYVADARFKANINKAGEGAAEFLSEAIAAYYG